MSKAVHSLFESDSLENEKLLKDTNFRSPLTQRSRISYILTILNFLQLHRPD